MFPPIYAVVSDDPTCQALLGVPPGTRIYPFGEADEGTPYPYVVWQVIGGSPENYLGNRPDVDNLALQVDVYGATSGAATAVAKAVRNAIERRAQITRWGPQPRDVETKSYRISFDVDWWVKR